MTTASGAGIRERELTFSSGEQKLTGTLALPASGVGPFPAAVLLSGSGPLDRDGNHKKLRFDVQRQLAAALAGVGVASLRYDKRGVGASPGDWRRAGLRDNIDDAAAAVEALRESGDVNADAVFAIGHSEGAVVASAVAGRGVPLAGIALLSGAARSGREVLRWQATVLAPTLPTPVRLLLRLLRVDLAAKVAKNHAKIESTTTDVARVGGARMNARWFREYLPYDPSRDLAAVDVPVLAVTGSKDLQTPPADLEAIAAAARGPVETVLLPDVTHTLRRQEAEPSLSRYKGELKRPVDAGVLDAVTSWVRRQVPVR